MKKISRLAILGALVALIAVPAANANCPIPNAWGQVDPSGSGANGYHLVILPSGAATDFGSIVGRYWQGGAQATNNNGTYDDSQWLRPYQGQFYLNGDNGLPGVVGCPKTNQILVLETSGTGGKAGQSFLAVSRVDETPADATFFNYNRVLVDIQLKPVSITKVSESRAGNVVTVTVGAPNSDSFFTQASLSTPFPTSGSITGWNVVRKNATTAADDSRAAAGWTSAGATLGSGATGQVTVDCGAVTNQDVLLGLQAAFADGVTSNYISQAAVVKCSGNLADPSGKFKIIERQAAPRPVQK